MKHFPPKKKYRKHFKSHLSFKRITQTSKLLYGTIGLQILEYGKISHLQLNALKKLLVFSLQRKGKIWLRVYPMIPKTNKPLEVRMGKGKGNVSFWETSLYPGNILFEVTTNDLRLAEEGFLQLQKRLSFKSKIIRRNEQL
jgi:large subunit ribosomal protein L16